MNATEALKEARGLLGRVLDYAETDYNFPEDVPVFAEARAFLALPSPVEEGTWNEAVETAAKVALDADVPGYEWTGAVLISGRIRRLRRDTSKPEESLADHIGKAVGLWKRNDGAPAVALMSEREFLAASKPEEKREVFVGCRGWAYGLVGFPRDFGFAHGDDCMSHGACEARLMAALTGEKP